MGERGGSLSQALAEFSVDLSLSRVPDRVLAHAKLLLLDTLGAALAGVSTPEVRAMMAAVARFAETAGPAGLWGTGLTAGRSAAALVNGTAAHALELDDFGGCDHSGAVVVPAVLAACEGGAVPGHRVLEALIVGYDVARRVLDAAGGYLDHNGRGWHSTATCGVFGAAAAVAKALGLDPEATGWAIGLAGSSAAGLWAFIADGAMSKRYHPGRAAESGVTAGFLAAEGFTGPSLVMEAEWGGFLSAYAGEGARPEAIRDGLGVDFKVMLSGVKPYACCRGVHPVLDFLLELRRREELTADQVRAVRVRCSPADLRLLGDRAPRTRLAAQMSLPYGVAVAIVAGRASLAEFEEPRLTDPRIRGCMDRVELAEDAALTGFDPPVVTVETGTGRRFEGTVRFARGDPRNPLPASEVVDKYTELAARALRPGAVAAARDAALAIEEPGAAARLLEALRGERSG